MAYANPEDKKAYDKKYRKENKETIAAYHIEYRLRDRKENPEKYRKMEKKRNAKPKRKLDQRAVASERRVKKLGNKPPKSWGAVDQEKIKEIYRLSAWLTKNRKQNYAVDHIIPVSKGGAHHQKNLRVLTENTNGRKGNKLDIECNFDIFYWVWETVG